MQGKFKVISPVDGSVFCERDYYSDSQIEKCLTSAEQIRKEWKQTSIDERSRVCFKVIEYFEKNVHQMAEEITWQMGRPIRYTPFEILGGFKERANYMINKAHESLRDVEVESVEGFQRFIRREPIGTVLVLSPWNYPYLTPVNAVVPAIMAGNPVILKHAEQTPLCAERFQEAFDYAEAPKGVFQYLHISHDQIPGVIQDNRIAGVFFTGSVPGGQAIKVSASQKFVNIGLELGGKDPAFVSADADLANAVENLVDGAFFNSGQSCCGIERIYVEEPVYDDFLAQFKSLTENYVVGNPFEESTTLGPLVRASARTRVEHQVSQALRLGAKPLISETHFSEVDSPYMNPQAYVSVDHSMIIMHEESFAPVVGIMKVSGEQQAIELMNDSDYGLTASIWTGDVEKALHIGDQIETGTWFMNRCDYLDPALAWTGVKNSGNGCTLSTLGYHYLTRPKSFHLKIS